MADISIFDTDNSGSSGSGSGSGSTGSTSGGSIPAATQSYNAAQVVQLIKDKLAAGQTTLLISKEDKDKITAILTGKADDADTSAASMTKFVKFAAIGFLIYIIIKPTPGKNA